MNGFDPTGVGMVDFFRVFVRTTNPIRLEVWRMLKEDLALLRLTLDGASDRVVVSALVYGQSLKSERRK